MQKHVNLVGLVKSFPTNIFLQNLASIQKRASLINFAHLAEKSEKGSILNLSTKARATFTRADQAREIEERLRAKQKELREQQKQQQKQQKGGQTSAIEARARAIEDLNQNRR